MKVSLAVLVLILLIVAPPVLSQEAPRWESSHLGSPEWEAARPVTRPSAVGALPSGLLDLDEAGTSPPGIIPPGGPILVTDLQNLAQRFVEISQRVQMLLRFATMIRQNAESLDFWLQSLDDWELIPYRESILPLLQRIGEAMREFEHLRGQFQAITYAFEGHQLNREFDLTFPGWRDWSSLGDGYTIDTAAGLYTFERPVDYWRYQRARTLQTYRQSLRNAGRFRTEYKDAELDLEALGRESEESVGTQQILESNTAFLRIAAQQLVGLRSQLLTLQDLEMAGHAATIGDPMQAVATLEGTGLEIGEQVVSEWGALLPDPRDDVGLEPLPGWAR